MARKTSLPGMLDAVEREAVDFLRAHEPPEGYQLCFSGGKDSIVMRHLADMAGVWEHIERYGLAYPSLYDNGFSRIGCKLCPLAFGTSAAAIAATKRKKEMYPRFVARFEAAIERWFVRINAARKAAGKKVYADDFNEFLKSYYTGFKDRGW